MVATLEYVQTVLPGFDSRLGLIFQDPGRIENPLKNSLGLPKNAGGVGRLRFGLFRNNTSGGGGGGDGGDGG